MSHINLQPDAAAMQDGGVNSTSATTAYGTSTTLSFAYYSPGFQVRSILLKWTFPTPPAGETLRKVDLIFTSQVAINTALSLSAHRILPANSGWTEGCTWNYANGSSIRWAGDTDNNGGANAGCYVSGTDYAATALGTWDCPGIDSETKFVITLEGDELASLVANNHGIILIPSNPSSAYTGTVYSSDYGTASSRPFLTFVYDPDVSVTQAGAYIEATGGRQAEATQIGAYVELDKTVRRVSTMGLMAEFLPPNIRRISTLGLMMELTEGTLPPAVRYGPRLQVS